MEPPPRSSRNPAGALQQTGMQIEHVAGVSLTAGRAVGAAGRWHGRPPHAWKGRRRRSGRSCPWYMKYSAMRSACIGCDVLQGSGIGGRGSHDGGVVSWHRASSRSSATLGDGGSLLADGNIDAEHVLCPSGSGWYRVAMEVLPVWRSPMISSRWPRPMGNMESMARMPV